MPRAQPLVALLAGLAAAGGCSVASPPPPVAVPATTAPAAAARVLADEPVAADIAHGERHRYRLDLPPRHWASIELWQRQADLDLRVLDETGEEVAAASTDGNWSDEVLDLVTGEEPLVVEVTTAAGEERGGGYRLRLAEERPALPDDPARVAARRAVREAARQPDAAEHLLRLRDEPPVAWSAAEAARLAVVLGDALFAANRVEEAEAAYRRGLDALTGTADAGRLAAELHRGIGLTAQKARRLQDARHHLAEAVALARATGDRAFLGSALNSEAFVLYEQRDTAAAVEILRQAAAAKREAGDLAGEMHAHTNLGHALLARGERRAASAAYEAALKAAEEGALADFDRLGLLVGLATEQRAVGEVDAALENLGQALDLTLDHGDADEEMSVLVHLGALLSQLGAYADARSHLERARELSAAAGDDDYRARALLVLGWTEIGAGDPSAAGERLTEALALAAPKSALEIQLLHALGTAAAAAGDREAAHRHLGRAAELARDGRMPRQIVDIDRALGGLALEDGALDAAQAALERSAHGADRLADPLRQAAAASLLARVAVRRGDPVAALEQALSAIARREEVRSRLADPALRASFLARWRDDFDLAIEMLMRLSELEPDGESRLRQAFRLSEDAHARTLSELLAEAKVEVRRGISEELLAAERAAERQLSQVQSELTEAHAGAADAARIAALEAEWRQAQREVERVRVDVRRRHARYAGIRYPQSPSVEEVQAQLPAGTALLEYALGEGSSALFVVTRDRFAALPISGVEAVAGRVAAVRELIDQPLAAPLLAGELAALSRLLLAPALPHLDGVDQLLVVPDRDLFYLPFEALSDPADPAAAPGGALRRWTVTYLPSAAVLGQLAAADGAPWEKEVLLLADPPALVATAAAELRGGGGPTLVPPGGLPSLPGARIEAKRIAEIFPHRADLRLGAEARETLLKTPSAVPPARRLHIASHGRIDEDEPAASFVLLAPDLAAQEDGLLLIDEVFNLDLDAELVVLSGCDTALGQRVDGEGLLGLARGFLYAGARELVVSLWPVADAATAELMVDFYRHLAAGVPPPDALRRAKLAALDGGAATRDWAGFVLFAPPATAQASR